MIYVNILYIKYLQFLMEDFISSNDYIPNDEHDQNESYNQQIGYIKLFRDAVKSKDLVAANKALEMLCESGFQIPPENNYKKVETLRYDCPKPRWAKYP